MHPFMGLTSWAAFTPEAHGGLTVMGDLVLFEDEVNAVMSAALDKTKETRTAQAQPGSKFAGPVTPETNSITATIHGKAVSNQMGVNTWAAFAGTDDSAFVDGDFAMLEGVATSDEDVAKGAAAALAKGLRSALDAQQPAQVVFVCEHGAAKSVIAAAYFNILAAESGLALQAISRGTAPDADFWVTTVTGLRIDGVAMQTGKPRLIAVEDLRGAAKVVTFGLQLPEGLLPAARVDWTGTPSPSADYGVARDDIRGRVEARLAELAAPKEH